MSAKKHATLMHAGRKRHVAGVFADNDARKDAEFEFENVLDDALQQKKKETAIQQRTLGKKEKEERLKQELHEERQRQLEAEAAAEEDTSHLMQEEIEDRERAERQKQAFNKMKLFFNRQLAAITRAFIDYGPPYKEDDLMAGVNLIAQCSNYPVRLFDLHLMLNERINPNMRDPEDLHYAAMHWCARNFSVIAMKMLRRAGADINIHNELDQTPLTMCVIVKQTDRRKYQMKALQYLLAEGAEVNTRDKAGYGPLDYAAMNQDEEIAKMLIDAGAVIVRVNKDLVAPRETALHHVTDPDTYRTILLKHEEEMAVIDKAAADELALKVANAEKARIRKLHRDLAKKRDNRIESVKLKELAEKNKTIRDQRMARLAAEEAADKAKLAERLLQFGEWQRQDDGHWQWEHRKTYENRTFSHLYVKAQEQMQDLRDYNCFEKFDGRWNAVTGKHLEVPWGRGEAFIVDGIDNKKAIVENTMKSVDKNSILYKDENDKELEGEDLDDLIGSLAGSAVTK